MKVVQINAVYGYGSTGHIVEDIHNVLQRENHNSYVFWATKCTEDGLKDRQIFRIGNYVDHKLHAFMWRIKRNQGWNSNISTKLLCKKIGKINPDIVHLHNLHSNYINLSKLLDFCEKRNISTVITLHDCWFFTGYCTHFVNYNYCSQWKKGGCIDCPAVNNKMLKKSIKKQFDKKKRLFEKIEHLAVIGVSDWITDCGNTSLLKNAQILRRIYNWIDNELFSPQSNTYEIKKRLGIKKDQAIILGVSQGWGEQKGLLEFQKLSEYFARKATVVLVGEPHGFLSTENLKFIGFTNNAHELAELYSAADVFVNPSRMETFGKVTAEALSCGTPVVAYNNTAMPEIVSDDVGVLVPDGNKTELINAVEKVLQRGKSWYTVSCRETAVREFNKSKQLEKYMDLYMELKN